MNEATERSLRKASSRISHILDRSLQARDLTEEEIVLLFGSEGMDFEALVAAADQLRKDRVGETVTYVVNRNINFTNVCVKRCSFCAFSRTHRSREGYYLPEEEIVRRAREAREFGATEVCIQAGLPPRHGG